MARKHTTHKMTVLPQSNIVATIATSKTRNRCIYIGEARSHADAVLFSASVDLLQALKRAVAMADARKLRAELKGIKVTRSKAMKKSYDQAIAAINKAEGRI